MLFPPWLRWMHVSDAFNASFLIHVSKTDEIIQLNIAGICVSPLIWKYEEAFWMYSDVQSFRNELNGTEKHQICQSTDYIKFNNFTMFNCIGIWTYPMQDHPVQKQTLIGTVAYIQYKLYIISRVFARFFYIWRFDKNMNVVWCQY